MKTIFRILIILVATAIVGSIIYALVDGNTSESSAGFGRQEGAEFRPGDNAEFPPDENGNFAPRPERNHEEFRGGSFLPGGAIKGLLIVSVVMIIWLNVGKLFSKVKAA
jgi:hypothetical protein